MSPRGGAVASPGGGNWGMFREAWDCNLARNDRNGWGGEERGGGKGRERRVLFKACQPSTLLSSKIGKSASHGIGLILAFPPSSF